MLALAEFRADSCPGCGGSLTETTDPAAEDSVHVPPPHRCHACTAIAKQQAGQYKTAEHPHALFWRFTVKRRRR